MAEEMMMIPDANDFGAQLQVVEGTVYCSLVPQTMEEKKMLYNATSSPANRLKECVNLPIEVVHVYCETVEVTNQETGEVQTCPRTILIDKDGEGYQAVSFGVFNSLKRLFKIFGAPPWEEPLVLVPKTVTKDKFQITVLEVQ